MQYAKAAESDRAAMNAICADDRGARTGRPAESASGTEAPRKLTMRHLHELIEALREEHVKLEMRVDKLSEMVDRVAKPEAGVGRDAEYGRGNREAKQDGGWNGEPRHADGRAGWVIAMPEQALNPETAASGREDETGRRSGSTFGRVGPSICRGEAAPDGREAPFGYRGVSFGRDDVSAGERHVPFSLDDLSLGRRDDPFGARDASPGERGVPFAAGAAADRGMAERSAAAEDRASFGIAIWAGVERAIGNAAAMLAAGREDGVRTADLPADRERAPVRPAALFRGRRSPEQERREMPIESLLLELREAARIADEIAANASADELQTGAVRPARAPDMARVWDSGGGQAPKPSAAAADGRAGADGGAAVGSDMPGDAGAAGHADPADGVDMTGSRGAAEAAAAAPRPEAEPAAGSRDAHAAAQSGAAQSKEAPAANAASQSRTWRMPSDSPPILVPRSERHRALKKRSLWTRLFRRKPAEL